MSGSKISSKASKKSRPAVFLDRDGTINHLAPGEYVHHPRDLKLLPGTASAIRSLNNKGYLVVVVTNQGAIAKGSTTSREVDAFHVLMTERLKKKGAHLDAVYYCPHHPSGTVLPHARRCRCRKPGTMMIKKAAKEMNIDIGRSFLVGDATSDILAGRRADLRTILVKTGYAGKDGKYKVNPDCVADDLRKASKIIPPATKHA